MEQLICILFLLVWIGLSLFVKRQHVGVLASVAVGLLAAIPSVFLCAFVIALVCGAMGAFN